MIRIEQTSDYEAVRNVIKQAFKNEQHSDHREHDLVDRLRLSDEFVPELSLVFEKDHHVVGHIMFTKIKISDNVALALAPLAVHPDYQGQGIGAALINSGIQSARELGYKGIIVLGHDKYYPKFGFVKASNFNITCPFPVPEEAFMALELSNEGFSNVMGVVNYSKAFMG